VNIDAFFMAVRPAQARLLVAQLQVFEGSDRPMLATSQVHDGDGNPRQDRDLDGVEFPELPWLLDDTRGDVPSRAEVQSLASARGAGARLFAFGIDAYQLVASLPQLSANPNTSITGATGELSLDGFGQVVRQPAWARFIGSRPRPAPDAEPLTIDTLPSASRDYRR
jgi:outer membrane PBP1 activator LpoA protein